MKPTPEATPLPIHVEVMAAAGPGVRLSLGNTGHPEIHLSIEQARALSLALIAAVNRKERESASRGADRILLSPPNGRA